MDPARYEKVKEVFNEACDCAPGHRAMVVDSLCAGDVELKREVESMLAQADAPAVDIDSAALDMVMEWGEALREEQAQGVPRGMPERIGPFRLLRVLGQGGMGVVYLAQQDKPARQVALKLIRPDLTSNDVMRRFDRETQALGRLQHPGIAQIFEAGVAIVGGTAQPYIAMEYVDGRTLLKFATEEQLGTRARLEILERIARAVDYAHQQGVIHRDLKPVNVLVDERGEPRVLDFGIARTTDDDVYTQTLRTGVGQLIGTLSYMSPEQVSGDPGGVDARSDVYGLGVIFFELLTGQLPVDVSDRSIPEAVRVITQSEPTRLGSVNRTLRGDLDTIVAKALEHEKDKRYASAGAMADDIRRFLDDQPILARPASTMYQMHKMARRNKALVVGSAAVLFVLIAGLMASTLGWMSALEHQRIAEREAERAMQVSHFVQGILSGVDPAVAKTMDTQLLERLLDEASANIEQGLSGQPEVEAEVRQTIGRTYHNAGLDARAEPHLRRAVALYERTEGARAFSTAVAKCTLASVLMDMGRENEAESFLLSALEVEREVLGAEDEQTFMAMNNLGELYLAMRRFDEADEVLSGVLAIARQNEAISVNAELVVMNNLAAVWTDQRRFDEARALREEVYARRIENDGVDHHSTVLALNNLAIFYDHHGPKEKVLPMYQEAYEKNKAYYGVRHPRTMMPMNNLAKVLIREGQHDEAASIFDELVEEVEASQGSPLFAAAIYKNAAMVNLKLERPEKAERLALRAVELAAGFDEGHPIVRIAGIAHGRALTAAGQYAEAERCLLGVAALVAKCVPADSPEQTSVMPVLIDLYEVWGRGDEAATWQSTMARAQRGPDGVEKFP